MLATIPGRNPKARCHVLLPRQLRTCWHHLCLHRWLQSTSPKSKNLKAKVLLSVCRSSSRAFLHHSCSDHVSLRISFRNCGREIRTWEDSRVRSPKLKKHASQPSWNLMELLKWRLFDLFLSVPATGAVTLVPTIPATRPAPKWSIGPSSRPVFVLAKCLVCLGVFQWVKKIYTNPSIEVPSYEKEAYQAYQPTLLYWQQWNAKILIDRHRTNCHTNASDLGTAASHCPTWMHFPEVPTTLTPEPRKILSTPSWRTSRKPDTFRGGIHAIKIFIRKHTPWKGRFKRSWYYHDLSLSL